MRLNQCGNSPDMWAPFPIFVGALTAFVLPLPAFVGALPQRL
jgi:hypothetical protein